MDHPIELDKLARYAACGSKPDSARLLLICGATCALSMAIPLLTRVLFDRLASFHQHNALLTALGVLLFIVSGVHLLEFLAALLRLRLQTRFSHRWKYGIMDRLFSLPPGFFRRFAVGELIDRAAIAGGEQERLAGSALANATSGMFLCLNLASLFLFDTRVGLVSLAGGTCLIAAALGSARIKFQRERNLLETESSLRSMVLQVFSGISKLRTASAESRIFGRWMDLLRRRQALGLASTRVSTWSAVLNTVIPIASTAGLLLAMSPDSPGSIRWSPGQCLAGFTAFSLYLEGILRLGSAVSDLAVTIPLWARATPILEAVPEAPLTAAKAKVLTGLVELRNISFRYSPDGPRILDGVNARLQPGEFLAVVGPSGSGKSTLVRLLLGLEQPSSGEVLYDGTPLRELNLPDVRRQIGTILQHDHLIAGNVYENISAIRAIPPEEAWRAARIAGLDRDLERLPMGMHSFVAPGAETFSGGERQRILIARAVAGLPRILIFDEATSALDNQVQAEIMRNLEDLEVTRIVIAHRLSTIRKADQILVLDRGRVVESGRYPELMAKNGLFFRLARRQSIEC